MIIFAFDKSFTFQLRRVNLNRNSILHWNNDDFPTFSFAFGAMRIHPRTEFSIPDPIGFHENPSESIRINVTSLQHLTSDTLYHPISLNRDPATKNSIPCGRILEIRWNSRWECWPEWRHLVIGINNIFTKRLNVIFVLHYHRYSDPRNSNGSILITEKSSEGNIRVYHRTSAEPQWKWC